MGFLLKLVLCFVLFVPLWLTQITAKTVIGVTGWGAGRLLAGVGYGSEKNFYLGPLLNSRRSAPDPRLFILH
jgi:hypothetical protein